MTVRFYSSVAQQTTLSGTINASVTSITVASVTGFPVSFPYTLAIDYGSSSNELVDVTNAAGTTLTVTRAIDGTSGQTHSSGANVRHVSSGRDFSDSRTHENTGTAVHGITGAVVGTTDTQSLSNKTLTSPTINSGALNGTFSGNPTFSGTPVFSGAALNGTYSGNPTFSGTPTFAGATMNGTYTGTPVFTGAPIFRGAGATSDAFAATVSGDTFNRFLSQADGTLRWGSGAATRDTNLYRSAVGTLKTDGDFSVAGNILSSTNVNTAAWTPYVVIWDQSSGTNPNIGNGTLIGKYQRIGRTINVNINMTAGTTTTFGNGGWRFSLPFAAANDTHFMVGVAHALCNGARYMGSNVVSAAATNTSPFMSSVSIVSQLFQANSTTPDSWVANSGNTLRLTFQYEAAS